MTCFADDDLPQDDLDDAGALDLDYTDSEFKMPLNVKKESGTGSDYVESDSGECSMEESVSPIKVVVTTH